MSLEGLREAVESRIPAYALFLPVLGPLLWAYMSRRSR